jgi:hypothetical protein
VIHALRERGLWPTENRSLNPQREQETDARYILPHTRLGPDEERLYAIADGLRLVDELRRSVRQDTDQAWEILAELADIERYLLNEWELGS